MKHVPFTNASIKAPKPTKPHICVRQGWWRVSAMPRTASGRVSKAWLYKFMFTKAHDHARIMNIDQGRSYG